MSAGALVVGVAVTGFASSEPKAGLPARPVYGTTFQVVNSSYAGGRVDFTHIVARCYASNGTCTITAGKSATNSIDVSLGWNSGGVASGLGISSAGSTSISVGCTSPRLRPGVAWTGYAVGRYFTYRIKKVTSAPSGVTSTYSGWLHAFSAYSNQIYCK
ncbi:hypothetical protein [Leifsonia xyli]|uniref:hypothetical protein n=1 Tax=Leifsonia xyli TaxID=1575 RepID=UPI003D677DBF